MGNFSFFTKKDNDCQSRKLLVEVYNFNYDMKNIDNEAIQTFNLEKSGNFCIYQNLIFYNEIQTNENVLSLMPMQGRFDKKLINVNIESEFYSLNNLFSKPTNNFEELLKNPVWINIQTFHNGYKLSNEDILKLGEIYLRVKEIKLTNLSNQALEKDHILSENNNICRICFNDGSCEEDPLINPCQCTGSVKYVHRNCLKQWINPKIKIKENINFTYIKWKKMICELCRSQYNYSYSGRNEISLQEFLKPKSNYTIIEKIDYSSYKIKGIYFIYPNKNNHFRIGSGLDNEITINKINISKNHLCFFLSNSNSYVKDLNSEYGSYCLMKDNIYNEFETESSMIQIENYLFHFNSNVSNSSQSFINEMDSNQRISAKEEANLREKINADLREQKENVEYMKNNFQMINSLAFQNDDLFYNELPGLNYF